MLTVFYSPHATSVDNEAGRAFGHFDTPLSEQGLQRARELGQHYAAQHINVVFCSDLQRAHNTALIAFDDRAISIKPDARLRECDYGQMTHVHPDDLHREEHVTEPYPGGESLEMVARRVGAFLSEVLFSHDGQTIVIIAHSATKYGLDYWADDTPLETIVRAPWEWRDVPIWRYEFSEPFRET